MKNKTPDIIKPQEINCNKPTKKFFKKKLASAQEARDIIEDLYENDYFPYDAAHIVRGNILLRIEDIKNQIKEL